MLINKEMFKKISVILLICLSINGCAKNSKHKWKDVGTGLAVAGVVALAILAANDPCAATADAAANEGWQDGFRNQKPKDLHRCNSEIQRYYTLNYDLGKSGKPVFRTYGATA